MKIVIRLVYVVGVSLFFSHVHAQYEIKKYVISNGGDSSAGGQYELSGIVGQVDANTTISNGSYSINSGYLQKNNDLIFKNKFD